MWLNEDGAYLIMRHIISILLENEPGALSRVSACSRNVATTSSPDRGTDRRPDSLSRMTIVTTGPTT
jgi:acetolactate synthase small subunit